MKKAALILGAFLVAAASATAATVGIFNPENTNIQRGQPVLAFNNVVLNGPAAIASSTAYDLFHSRQPYSLWIRCTGAMPDVWIDFQSSPSLEEGDFTAGSSATSSVHFTGPSGASMLYSMTPIPARYGRLYAHADQTNGPDTACKAQLYLSPPIDP